MKRTIILNSITPGKRLAYNRPEPEDQIIKGIKIASLVALIIAVLTIIMSYIW